MADHPPDYPPECADDAAQTHLLAAFTDYARAHGLAVKPPPAFAPDPHNALATVAPVSLFPSLFPRRCFDEALRVQPLYNAVYAAVACGAEWLDQLAAEWAAPTPARPGHCWLGPC